MTVYGTFGGFAHYFRKKASVIDNATFRLHYRATFALLIAFSLLVTMSQFFGAPIACIVDGVPGGIMNTYCWIHGTFTIPSQLAKKVGTEVPHPGVAPMRNPIDEVESEKGHIGWNKEGDEIRHAWYQWVCFVLFIQAILCYLPHYIWKMCEGGKINMLMQNMSGQMLDPNPSKFETERVKFTNYFLRSINSHSSYVYKFVFCEILNLVNVLFQIYLMDVFFGGQFSRYGSDVLSVSEQPLEDRVDPMNRVFPKVTKCTFHKYGPSGTVENKDGLCILAMNIINEKIYVFLWFWYIFLAVWTAIHLMFRIISIASAHVRYLLFVRHCQSVNRSDIATVLRKCNYGDWFLLMQLGKHVNPAIYHDLVLDLRDRLDQKRADNLSES